MLLLKVAPLFLVAILVAAEKKIELQDIEEDNLRSEKQKHFEKSAVRPQEEANVASAPSLPLDYLKNGYFQFFKEPTQQAQPQRFVHQYAVTEQPEAPPVTPKPQYGPPPQQTMLGYLSNLPMQIYLVPQYYSEPSEQDHQQPGVQLQEGHTVAQVSSYHDAQNTQQQSGYIEVPGYVTPSGKTYIQPYTQHVPYITYAHPTIAPIQSTVTPVLAYQMPVAHYPTALSAPPPKGYYQSTQYPESNAVDNEQENEVNIAKPYPSHNEIPLSRPSGPGYPRYYSSRTPVTEGYRAPLELPNPNPLLLKAAPPHLSHIPKTLPIYRPVTKPVYATGGGFATSSFTPRPSETFGIPYKRRPTSLLDSYIPSRVQIEYMKKGYAKDPLAAYEALSSSRYLTQSSQSPVIPRHYERGFLPNQVYHTAGGGITFGHHKRATNKQN